MNDLRTLRAKKELTQQALGKLVGVGQRRIARYESGIHKPPPSVAERIRDLFGLTTEEMWEMLYRDAS